MVQVHQRVDFLEGNRRRITLLVGTRHGRRIDRALGSTAELNSALHAIASADIPTIRGSARWQVSIFRRNFDSDGAETRPTRLSTITTATSHTARAFRTDGLKLVTKARRALEHGSLLLEGVSSEEYIDNASTELDFGFLQSAYDNGYFEIRGLIYD
jgi:hypothetical protein